MADKQTALVAAIAQGVKAEITPDFAKLATEIAKLSVTQNAVLARLEVLESAVSTGGPAAKRTVRTTAAAKGGAKKTAAKKGAAGDDKSKVTNALLYFRYAMANDLDDSQALFGSEENLDEAEKDATVAKRDKDKEPSGYWSAVGAALWKTVLTDDQKEDIRAQFASWKEQVARDDQDGQLEEDI
jgi:hypothetical protein